MNTSDLLRKQSELSINYHNENLSLKTINLSAVKLLEKINIKLDHRINDHEFYLLQQAKRKLTSLINITDMGL